MSPSRKPTRPRRSFSAEFKAEIVQRRRAGDRAIGQVARDFDLTETAVCEKPLHYSTGDSRRAQIRVTAKRASAVIVAAVRS